MKRVTMVVLALGACAAVGARWLWQGHATVEPSALACAPGEGCDTGAPAEHATADRTEWVTAAQPLDAVRDPALAALSDMLTHARASGVRSGRPTPPEQPVHRMEDYVARNQMYERLLPQADRGDYGKWNGFCPADLDKNNVVDAADAALFVQVWQNESHELTAWADVNNDGTIDSSDIIEFMQRYIEQDCDPEQMSAMRSTWC